MANVVRSTNAQGRPAAPPKEAKIDEYGFMFVVNGKAVNVAATLVDMVTGKGKAYSKVHGANGFSGAAVMSNLPGLPTDIAVVAFSRGEGVKVLGKVHGKVGIQPSTITREILELDPSTGKNVGTGEYETIANPNAGKTFVQFDGLLDEPLPNGAVRINSVRIQQSDAGWSIWAKCGHFVTSWHRGSTAASNATGTTVKLASGLSLV